MVFKKKKPAKKPRKRAPMQDPEIQPAQPMVPPEGSEKEASAPPEPKQVEKHLEEPQVRDLFRDDEGVFHLIVTVDDATVGHVHSKKHVSFYEVSWDALIGRAHAIGRDKMVALPWSWVANIEDKWA
jgi:hypothetical protein